MERRQLECLVAVVETGGFQRAADRLFVTQSAVSQAVKALERELGEPLLDRGGGRAALTEAGRLFLPAAREALRRMEEGRQAVTQLRGLLTGRLALGAVDVAAIYHLPDPLRRFHRAHPRLEISVHVAGSRQLLADLRAGELDLAFVLGEGIPDGLAGRPFAEDPMRVLAPADWLAGEPPPAPADLAARGWITYPRGSVTRDIIEAAFARAGLPFPVRMAIDRPEVILQLVRAGLGLAVLPERLLETWGPGEGIGYADLPSLALARPIRLVHRPEPALPPAARRFLEIVEARAAPPEGE